MLRVGIILLMTVLMGETFASPITLFSARNHCQYKRSRI